MLSWPSRGEVSCRDAWRRTACMCAQSSQRRRIRIAAADPSQVLHLRFDPVDEGSAREAIPLEPIDFVRARGLDDEAHRALRTLRRMAYMRRQQKHLALPDRNVVEFTVLDHLEHHVAPELIKELFHGVIVIVGALVRAADDLHGHLALSENFLVADRWLEQMLVRLDPALEVECVPPCVHRLCREHGTLLLVSPLPVLPLSRRRARCDIASVPLR